MWKQYNRHRKGASRLTDIGVAWKGISETPPITVIGGVSLIGKLYVRAGDGLLDQLIRFVARSVEHDRYAPKPVATPCYS